MHMENTTTIQGAGQGTVATTTNGRIRAWVKWTGRRWAVTWATVQQHSLWVMVEGDWRSFDEAVAGMKRFVAAAS
jgi:hypothetical protein